MSGFSVPTFFVVIDLTGCTDRFKITLVRHLTGYGLKISGYLFGQVNIVK